jgi:hypothetical protein
MAKLHKTIVQNRVSNVPDYKQFFKSNLLNAPSANLMEQEGVLEILDKLIDGDTLCHGDFHPGKYITIKWADNGYRLHECVPWRFFV